MVNAVCPFTSSSVVACAIVPMPRNALVSGSPVTTSGANQTAAPTVVHVTSDKTMMTATKAWRCCRAAAASRRAKGAAFLWSTSLHFATAVPLPHMWHRGCFDDPGKWASPHDYAACLVCGERDGNGAGRNQCVDGDCEPRTRVSHDRDPGRYRRWAGCVSSLDFPGGRSGLRFVTAGYRRFVQ